MIYTTTTTTTIRKTGIIAITVLAFLLDGVHSFQSARMPFTPSRATLSTALLGEKSSFSENMSQGQQESEEVLFGGEAMLDYAQDLPTDDQISNSLNQKLKELEYGIGKRYRIRTQKGFLNVHHEPIDPYLSDNVVNQLEEGKIVTATGPQRGIWIPHDGGGWSVSKYGGFTWLEPIDE